MLHKERFHNSHLEVINNSSSKVSMGWKKKKATLFCRVPYRQVSPATTQLSALTKTCFYASGRRNESCWNTVYLRELHSGWHKPNLTSCLSPSVNLHPIEAHGFEFRVYAMATLSHGHWERQLFEFLAFLSLCTVSPADVTGLNSSRGLKNCRWSLTPHFSMINPFLASSKTTKSFSWVTWHPFPCFIHFQTLVILS